MFDPARNTLDEATSPYLRQHRDNPVHWQQWSTAAFDYAAEHDLIVFVSVGYSTCHWCHVMAAGAFSNPDVAAYLNDHFVSIKVDREERPDIDQYLMSFLVDTTGQGGWPLNAFLSPKQETFFAMTYAPAPDDPRASTMMSFDKILQRVHEFYHQKKDQLGVYEPSRGADAAPGAIVRNKSIDLDDVQSVGADIAPIAERIAGSFDREWAGFGGGPKFPPHSTLLWMLNAHAALTPASGGETAERPEPATSHSGSTAAERPEPATSHSGSTAAERSEPGTPASGETASRLEEMSRLLLDVMARRGLHDHLQGGFFRYCVDGRWTVPHFEKMLYDQALLLWNYSSAAYHFGEQRYAAIAEGIVRCLSETFLESQHGLDGGLFVSAHDADTDHEEGGTYVWTHQALREALSDEQWQAFAQAFELPDGGNFEGKLHLVGSAAYSGESASNPALRSAFERLLAVRGGRPQPFTDRKVVTSWNALAAIALLVGGRLLARGEWITRAHATARELTERHDRGDSLIHASLAGEAGSGDFLEDHAALALLYTYLAEEEAHELDEASGEQHADAGESWISRAASMIERMQNFRTESGTWVESHQRDFRAVSPESFDQPVPSSVSMADFALARYAMVRHVQWEHTQPQQPLMRDFRNLSSLARSGMFYIIETPHEREWAAVPLNSIWSPGASPRYCFAGACRPGLPRRAPG